MKGTRKLSSSQLTRGNNRRLSIIKRSAPDPSSRQILNSYADQFGIKIQEDWYQIQRETVAKQKHGRSLLTKSSMVSLLRDSYPEFDWHEWKCSVLPNGYWTKTQNRRAYFDWLAYELGVDKTHNFYSVSFEQIKDKNGSSAMRCYNDSLYNALCSVYPEYKWNIWNFEYFSVPNGFWCEKENQRAYLNWIGEELGISDMDDWYNVTTVDLRYRGGVALLGQYGHNMYNILSTLYPQHEWLEWQFKSVTQGFWDNFSNQRRCLNWLADKLNIRTSEDWYNINFAEARKLNRVFELYGGSAIKTLSVVYPEFQWLPWKFMKISNRFWHELQNQKMYFDWLGITLGYEHRSDWYNIESKQIEEHGAKLFLEMHYGGSFFKAISTVYADTQWHDWLFVNLTLPSGFWQDMSNVTKYVEWLSTQLYITSPEDWTRVTLLDVHRLHGGSLLSRYNQSLSNLLSAVYPKHDDTWKAMREHAKGNSDKNQQYLLHLVKESIPQNKSINANISSSTALKVDHQLGNSRAHYVTKKQLKKQVVDQVRSKYWFQLKKKVAPRYWFKMKNRRALFDSVGAKLGVKTYEDWYKVPLLEFHKMGTKAMLQHYYDDSFHKALVDIYPEYPWEMWKFEIVPKGWWSNIRNQRKFLDWLLDSHNCEDQTGFYKIGVRTVKEAGGRRMVQMYNSSWRRMLETLYPEYEWLPWLFLRVDSHYWSSTQHVEEYIQWISNKFQITDVAQWRSLPITAVTQTGGWGLVHTWGGLIKYFQQTRNLDISTRSKFPPKTENLLLMTVAEICNSLDPSKLRKNTDEVTTE